MANTPQPNREKEIFERALDLESAEQRQRFLEQVCGQDAALLARVQALLRANEEESRFLPDEPAQSATVLNAAVTERAGDRIGHYKLLQQIGEGGCGIVYMAEQEEPVRRRVALKVIKLGMDTKSVIARFEAERQALALMDHPNIAKVLDAGATEAGRPYFVMELVRGVKITEFCDEGKLPTHERLDLFIQVCQAIQHAHQKGVIHRDIKPSNILVTVNDGVPVPKVIDFGIAKATAGRLTDKTLFTAFEQFMGTPAYMSPEQAVMTSLDIDTRSDIYSLGVLLYELLTGKTPFDASELLKAGLDEMRRTIREKEPARPSTRVGTLRGEELTTTAKRRSSDAPKLIHLLKGDLDWIVMKCLEKDRGRRYDTANGLARDIERHLNNEPVVARPPSTAYRFQKLVRRNKLIFAAVAAVASSLVMGLCVSTWLFIKESQARRQARAAAIEQSRLRQIADEQRQKADKSAEELRDNLYASEMSQAFAAFRAGSIQRARDLLARQRQAAIGDRRGFEWRWLWGQTRPAEQFVLSVPELPTISHVNFSPDGQRFVMSGNGSLEVRDTVTKELVISNRHDFSYHAQFSRDGKFIVSSDMGAREAKLWDATTGALLNNFGGHTQGVAFAEISPDGRLLASTGTYGYTTQDGEIFLWDMASKQKLAVLQESGSQMIFGARFSPDSQMLAAGCGNGHILLWDVSSRRIISRLKGHLGGIMGICFTPDGKRLVSAGLDRTVRLWDLSEGKETSLLGLHEKSVARIAISLDGRLAASTGFDHVVKVWNLDPPGLLQTLRGHEARVWGAAFHPNGLMLATSGGDGTVRFWKVPQRPEEWVLEGVDAWSFGFSSKSRLLFGLTREGHIDVWDMATRTQIIHVPGDHAWWVPDSEHIVFIRGVQLIELDVATKSEQILGTAGESAEGLRGTRSSLDGRLLAWGHSDHVHVFDRTSRIEVARLETGKDRDEKIAFSADGSTLATAGWVTNVIQLWDTATWRRVKSLEGHERGITAICFSPKGLELASASPDRTVRVWNLSTGKQWALRDDEGDPGSLAFSPDGRTLATGTFEGSVKLWDVVTRQQIASFAAGVSHVDSLHFAPDGSALGSTTFDRKVRVWQAPLWAEVDAVEAKEKAETKQNRKASAQ